MVKLLNKMKRKAKGNNFSFFSLLSDFEKQCKININEKAIRDRISDKAQTKLIIA